MKKPAKKSAAAKKKAKPGAKAAVKKSAKPAPKAKASKPAARAASKAAPKPAARAAATSYTPQPIEGIGWAPFRYPLS